MPFSNVPVPYIFRTDPNRRYLDLKEFKLSLTPLMFWRGENISQAVDQHNRHQISLLQRCRDKGTKLQPEKIRFLVRAACYYGNSFTSEETNVDPAKVQIITELEQPLAELVIKRYLSMINYYSWYLPHSDGISV